MSCLSTKSPVSVKNVRCDCANWLCSLSVTTWPSASTAPTPAPASESAGMPDVMTPQQAAEILQVSYEDVVAAIEAGDLKARKIGNAYRISKANMEEFLAG